MNAVAPNLRTADQNRKLWWLAGQLGLDKEAMADVVLEFTEGRTCHTSELTFLECRELTEFLQGTLIGHDRRDSRAERTDQKRDGDPDRVKLDRQRKGVIRAIYRWLELRGVTNASMDYVKAIACRAAKADSFNRISPDALTRVYAEFCHKQESLSAMRNVELGIAMQN